MMMMQHPLMSWCMFNLQRLWGPSMKAAVPAHLRHGVLIRDLPHELQSLALILSFALLFLLFLHPSVIALQL